ncbi:MAG: GNAT family N-acetyltransferase [Parvularculaceae bacterium]|nr:GNAT family N-acetyltransferase [Parvularculaceae bacterium]
MARRARIACKPLTPDRWDDFCAVMGPAGGCWGCWCMYWRAPRMDIAGPARKTFKARMRAIVRKGPPPGLIAYRGGDPVGWVQVGPRPATPNWNGARRLSAPIDAGEADDAKIWAISCFVVPRAHRRQGVAADLLAGAVKWARKNRARFIDGCPVETSDRAANPASIYHGVASMFGSAGFR